MTVVAYPRSASELVVAVREQREKCRVLHEERGKAWHVARQADAAHEFLVAAGRAADAELRELDHRLTIAARREAETSNSTDTKAGEC